MSQVDCTCNQYIFYEELFYKDLEGNLSEVCGGCLGVNYR